MDTILTSLRRRRFNSLTEVSLGNPQLVLAICATFNILLTGLAMGGGKLGLFALLGTLFFMSIMFPTIFGLAAR